MEARICIKIVSLLHERLINVTIGQSAKPQARRLQGRPSILIVSKGLWPAFLRGTTGLLWGSPNQKTGGQGDNRWDRSPGRQARDGQQGDKPRGPEATLPRVEMTAGLRHQPGTPAQAPKPGRPCPVQLTCTINHHRAPCAFTQSLGYPGNFSPGISFLCVWNKCDSCFVRVVSIPHPTHTLTRSLETPPP